MIPLIKNLDVDEINTSLIAIRKLLNNVGITETNITNIIGKDYDAKIQELEEKVEADDTYSTTEVKTNKKWIDGKPIYRKTFEINAQMNGGDLFSISNMDSYISSGGYCYMSFSSSPMAFPVTLADTHANCHLINSNGVTLYVNRSGANYISAGSKIWIEYTKTTD